jgi:hypothetical protein
LRHARFVESRARLATFQASAAKETLVNRSVTARSWFGSLLSVAVLFGPSAGLSGPAQAETTASPPADFGTPPSGEVPILFNDRHVYSKPDKLKEGRVLAALVKGSTILVPLRSLFEQTGATVSYDPATKTVDVSKPGAEVKVTVGKPVVSINGEDRPLDVPPEVYRGAILVPLRVISEGMGAYVQWVAEKRLVVVRYNPAPVPSPPPPTEAPTPPPTPAPTAAPTATPSPTPLPTIGYEAFVAGDYDVSPKVYNELAPGQNGNAYSLKGAVEFPLAGERWMVDGDFQQLRYAHPANLGFGACAGGPGCTTVIGKDPVYQYGPCPSADPGCVTTVGYQNVVALNGLGQAYVPAFTAIESTFDAHLGLKVADPRVYVGVGGFFKSERYLGYPNLSGVGFGAEKLPDLENPLSFYASVWYYPSISGTYTYPTSKFLGPLSGSTATLSYSALTYEIGGTIDFGKSPLYLDFGYQGERFGAKSNAPSDGNVGGPFVGLGLHI